MADHEKTKTVIKRFTRAAVCSIIGAVVTLKTDTPLLIASVNFYALNGGSIISPFNKISEERR